MRSAHGVFWFNIAKCMSFKRSILYTFHRLFSGLRVDKQFGNQEKHAFETSRKKYSFIMQSVSRHISSSFKYCQLSTEHNPGITSTVNPFKFVEKDIRKVYEDIRKELESAREELKEISNYYFDGQGKAFRPMVAILIAKALNYHMFRSNSLLDSQFKVAATTEMIHVASLLHDDVIDTSDIRRGKLSANAVWGQKKAVFAGDFILSVAAKIIANIGNSEVIVLLSQVLSDLVNGEFMQLGSRETTDQRFSHYLQKTYRKTASLIAFSCQSMAVLCEANLEIQNIAFQYGKNLGIAFQLIDDLLDFISSQTEMGKPTTVDLKLGLATAPVLFACEKHPALNSLIMRRFSQPGDVEKAYEMVMNSDGIENTRLLAKKHCDEALKYIACLENTLEKKVLISLVEIILRRSK